MSSSSGSSGASSGYSGSSRGSYVDSTTRCKEIATAACQHDATCGFGDSDLSACIATFNCDNSAAETLVDEEVDAGAVTFDSTALSNCRSEIVAGDCTLTGADVQHASVYCAVIARGPGAQGDACVVAADCQPQSSCVRSDLACSTGTCQPWSSTGACGVGLAAVAAGSYCADDGGVVAQARSGTPCDADKECQDGLLCVGPSGARTCATPGTSHAGAPCDGMHECDYALTCIGSASDAGFCWARSFLGGSCNTVYVDGGLNLRSDGGYRADNALCYNDEYCDPGSALCAPNASIDEPCLPDGGLPRCLQGECVDPGDGGGICLWQAAGTPCSRGADCLSSACVLVVDGGTVCGDTCP